MGMKNRLPAVLQGHPSGLAVMALTEVWERLAYYGMRAILVLFLVDTAQGFSLDGDYAASLYGLFLSIAYMTSLLGGWFGDRVLGTAQAIVLGSVFLIAGNAVLAFAETPNVFYFGLFVLIVAGISLLKPNISAMIAFLYPEGGSRRDTAFYLFFLAITVGALLGPFVTATVAEPWGFRAGFAAAAVGMALGFLQLVFALKAGVVRNKRPEQDRSFQGFSRTTKWVVTITILSLLLASGIVLFAEIEVEISRLMDVLTGLLLCSAVGYFGYFLFLGDLSSEEKKGVLGVLVLFVGATLFYLGFSQPGSSFNLFALRFTDRTVGDFEIPTGWFQGSIPAFTLLLTPFFASLWLRLEKGGKNPPVVAKFSLALLLMGLTFLVLSFAAMAASDGKMVSPIWLMAAYFVQTCSEIILIPIGLSFFTKLMPDRYVGQGMGIWFLSVSIGYMLGGRFAGSIDYSTAGGMTYPFLCVAILFTVAGAILLAVVRAVRPLYRNVE